MDRPSVVLNAVASVDGRIALTREQPLMFPPSSAVWAGLLEGAPDVMGELRRRYEPGAVLSGSGSFVGPHERAFDGPPGDNTDHLRADLVARAPRSWFAVADSRGRVRWSIFAEGGAELLVLVCRSSPAAYLEFLREHDVCHLVVGDERVDPALALQRMREVLGVTCVVADGGGEWTASLLRAGLVDELWLTMVPALIGGAGTPGIVDGEPLVIGESPRPVRLVESRTDNGFVVLRYAVGGR